MLIGLALNDDIVTFVAVNTEVLPYGFNKLRYEVKGNGFFLDGFTFGTIPDEASVEGNDEASILPKFQLFCKRTDAIKRPSTGKDDSQSMFLSLYENLLRERRDSFISGE